MSGFDPNDPRAVALSLAIHAAKLEDRVAFAETILPLVDRFSAEVRMLGFVCAQLPQGLPPQQWLALAEDMVAFLLPGVEARRAGRDGPPPREDA